jgi:hypothetical protein
MKKFLKANLIEDTNMTVAVFVSDAINYFKKLPFEKVKKIVFEIVTIGIQGLDLNKKTCAISSTKDCNF